MVPHSGNHKKYINKNPLMNLVISNFVNQVKQLVDSEDINNILDVGCGEGFIINSLKKNNLIGIDISENALTIAKKNNPECMLCKGNIYGLPLKKNSFDLVIALEVLEHLDNFEIAINEIKRVTVKYCLFSVPNEPYFKLMNLLRGKNITRFGNDIEHVQSWSTNEFALLLEKHFEVMAIKTPFPWTLVLCKKTLD